MTEYICKCGRKLQRSTQSETTGNKLDGYAPGHECFGCPYVVPITRFENGHFVPDHYECVASKALRYETYAGLFSFGRDSTAGHILSLDFDFLRRVAAECDKHEAAISLNREKDGQMFHYKSKYRPDGRFDFTIYPTQNKAGANAKRAIFEKFFTDGGARKDLTPEQEKEKILNDIQEGRLSELPQPYIPGDIYIDPLDHSRMRVVDVTPDKKERTWQVQSDDGDGWEPANSSVFPHLHDAVATLGAFVRSYGLIPDLESNDPPEASPTSSAAATVAAEAAVQPPTEPALANTTAEPAAGGSDPEERALAANPAASGISEPPAAFDYAGLDAQTVADLHLAEREYASGKRMAEMGLRRMADGVAIAHEALCGACDNLSQAHNNQHSENTFGAWCESVGINRKAAERLLQVSRLFDSSSPRQQKALEELSPSLLYAAAKPSAPEELVQAVKAGDITTHKQYQELLAQLKAKSDELAAVKAEAALDRKEQQDANAAAQRYKAEADRRAADQQRMEGRIKGLEDSYRTAHANEEFAIRRAADAEAKAREAESQLAGARQVAEAARLRADRWKEKAEAAQAQAAPATVEAVVDQDEVNRLAEEKAQAIAAQQTAESVAARGALQDRIDELEELLDDAAQDQIANTQALAVQAVEACEGLIGALFGHILLLPDTQYLPAKHIVESFSAKLGWALDNNDWPDPDTWEWAQQQEKEPAEEEEEEADEDD